MPEEESTQDFPRSRRGSPIITLPLILPVIALYNAFPIGYLLLDSFRDQLLFLVAVGMLVIEAPVICLLIIYFLRQRAVAQGQGDSAALPFLPTVLGGERALRLMSIGLLSIVVVVYNAIAFFFFDSREEAIALLLLAVEAVVLLGVSLSRLRMYFAVAALVFCVYNFVVCNLVIDGELYFAAMFVLLECTIAMGGLARVRKGEPFFPGLRLPSARAPMQPRRRARILVALSTRLSQGETLSEAMAGMRRFFPPHFAGRMRAAEAVGSVSACLDALAEESIVRVQEATSVAMRMAYIVLLALLQIQIVLFLLIKVVPVFAELFSEFGSAMPGRMQHIIAAGDLFIYRWPRMLMAASLMVINLVAAYRYLPWLRLALSHVLLRIPAFGSSIRYRTAARSARVLGELAEAGTPLPEALDLAAHPGVQPAFQRLFMRWRERAALGASLSECANAVTSSWPMPASFSRLAALGESAGCVRDALGQAAAHYDALAAREEGFARTMMFPIMLAPFAFTAYYFTSAIFESLAQMTDAMFYAL